MQKKYIHYCWFGGKPLSKLAKKCIKSWKKYLPDYEIIEWNESNVDINECPFIKEAYKLKKWAFVADYARTKALYEMGGIYLDTDMIIKKDINHILDKDTFLGIEDSMLVNAAVWGEKAPKSYLSKKLLDKYRSMEHFDINDIYKMTIPRIITNILYDFGLNPTSNDIQKLSHNIYIYPRDYFYPLSYEGLNNKFTNNTCMVHYFQGTWNTKAEQIETEMIRKIGLKPTEFILKNYRRVKRYGKKGIKLVLFPVVIYTNYKRKINKNYLTNLNNAINDIRKAKKDYVAFHNPEWFGLTNATIELFDSRVRCGELLRKKDIKTIGDEIIKKNIKQVIFSAMCLGWKDLAYYLKSQNQDIKIKVFWHGNNSQVSEPYGWARNIEIFDMNKDGIIDVIATCKKSIIDFYKYHGIKTTFITNKVVLPKKYENNTNKDEVRIGIYAAKTDDYRKNMYTNVCAASLIPNAVIDMVPINEEAQRLAIALGLKIDGTKTTLKREELFKRMANNTINLYVTLSECSPMLPLESFEVGVPCIFGNNHHYFENNKLKDILLVNNETNPIEIKEKIEYVIKNKDEILKEYKKWVKENNKESDMEVKNFLEM